MGLDISVIVADDHDIVRSGILVLLDMIEEYNFIATEVTSYKELQNVLKTDEYGLLILDLNLGDKMGVEMVREISDTYTNLPILVLSMYPEEPYALHTIKSGALGYVNKCNVKEQLTLAIFTILDKKVYLSDAYKDKIPYGTELIKSDIKMIDILSKRESEIFYLLSREFSLNEIAEHLHISYKTVHTYMTRICQKLSLSDKKQLIDFIKFNEFCK